MAWLRPALQRFYCNDAIRKEDIYYKLSRGSRCVWLLLLSATLLRRGAAASFIMGEKEEWEEGGRGGEDSVIDTESSVKNFISNDE